MSASNKVRIEIGGAKYTIATNEPDEYVNSLAAEIGKLIDEAMSKSSTMSLNNALVLSTLHYADLYKKSEANSDHLRSQVTDYLEDAARARIEMDEARREIGRLKRELDSYKKA